ncbi:organic hydroperoxide resistance protein [Paenibacillus sp. sptzw28]|uniref:organic hydroperoxide resistance protein n=1 Tax=Paenibacillus sp. sptzw28 TaxID=715179 RepID=UPI001C6E5B5F|nr:organic hydroperoxide resistance protein [Paenibacillus sp. sptzw28]QYR22455.1 organic hydroperoxide resistance protein [Paenibacillus sp. sptzw28]
METIYTAQVTSHGGRDGVVRSSDGHLNLKVATPKKEGGEGTNPEQLFAAGYSACFHSALKSIAKTKEIDTDESEVTASVSLHKGDDGFSLSARLDVRIPGLSEEQVMSLAKAAHEMCPYSKATRGNIDVELKAITEQMQP